MMRHIESSLRKMRSWAPERKGRKGRHKVDYLPSPWVEPGNTIIQAVEVE